MDSEMSPLWGKIVTEETYKITHMSTHESKQGYARCVTSNGTSFNCTLTAKFALL